jgi:hypothetical protein
VGYVDLVSIGDREKIIVNVFGDDDGSTSFCWHIEDKRGKLVNK